MVTSKGQVTLRNELLAHLGVDPGQRLGVGAAAGVSLQRQREGGSTGCPRRAGAGEPVRLLL